MLFIRNHNFILINLIKTNFRNLSRISNKSLEENKANSGMKVNSLHNRFIFGLCSVNSTHILTKKQSIFNLYSVGYKNMSSDAEKKIEKADNVQVLSTKEKLKKAVKEYGSTVIVFHITISLLSLGGFYSLVSSGVDVISILDWIGINTSKFAAGTSTFVLAYAIHKVFAPVRMTITLGATPIIVRYLRKKNFIK